MVLFGNPSSNNVEILFGDEVTRSRQTVKNEALGRRDAAVKDKEVALPIVAYLKGTPNGAFVLTYRNSGFKKYPYRHERRSE